MKKKEICTVIRQKEIGDGIFSMWIQTENIGKEAKPGQFVSLYSKDGSKLLPRPISLCEIDRENSRLRLVYRVTGTKTGTEEFSGLKAGDTIPVIGPLGNGFPVEKTEGKRVFLMGGRYRSTADPGTGKTDAVREKTNRCGIPQRADLLKRRI